MSRQYGRENVDYQSFYSDWMKRLARQHSIDDLNRMLHGSQFDVKAAALSHLRAVEATTSYPGPAARRAQAKNLVEAAGDTAIAIRGAIEIHELFPECSKKAES